MSYLKLSLIFILALSLWSCKKDSETEPTLQDTAEGGALIATIDGVAFKADESVIGDIRPINEGNDTLLFFVSGKQIVDEKSNIVQVTVDDYRGVGTYVLGTPTDNTGLYGVNTTGGFDAIRYNARKDSNTATGTLEITEETAERVNGTFEFTGINDAGESKLVKGEFSLKL